MTWAGEGPEISPFDPGDMQKADKAAKKENVRKRSSSLPTTIMSDPLLELSLWYRRGKGSVGGVCHYCLREGPADKKQTDSAQILTRTQQNLRLKRGIPPEVQARSGKKAENNSTHGNTRRNQKKAPDQTEFRKEKLGIS